MIGARKNELAGSYDFSAMPARTGLDLVREQVARPGRDAPQ